MNGVVYCEEQVISEFTLAMLEDSGYYQDNYYIGGLMQYGKNKGCDFLNNKYVINGGEVNPKFKNEFFYSDLFYGNVDPSFSRRRQSRAYNYFINFTEFKEEIPPAFNYYSNGLGGRASADYCPVSQQYYYGESQYRYFVGHCSTKGGVGYGTLLRPLYNKINGIQQFNNNGDLASITGEKNIFILFVI